MKRRNHKPRNQVLFKIRDDNSSSFVLPLSPVNYKKGNLVTIESKDDFYLKCNGKYRILRKDRIKAKWMVHIIPPTITRLIVKRINK